VGFARLQISFNQPAGLTCFDVAIGGQLGIDEGIVEGDLETPAARRRQGDALDVLLEMVEQVGRQTGGAIGVVSDGAVFDRNL